MDQSDLEKFVKMMASENDIDAVMGLRGLQAACRASGVGLDALLSFAVQNLGAIKKEGMTFDNVAATPAKSAASAPVSVSGMPQCRMPKPGYVEIIAPGQTQGEQVQLPGASAAEAETIASNLKDALVAAIINKSRFKLKLLDIKNNRGEIVETVLQAEYDRQGMTPLRVWVNIRGEVAALATVLRKTVSNSLPDLVAA